MTLSPPSRSISVRQGPKVREFGRAASPRGYLSPQRHQGECVRAPAGWRRCARLHPVRSSPVRSVAAVQSGRIDPRTPL